MTDRMIGELPRPDDGDIDVLFVDDNEEWVELATRRIERHADDIDVSVAGSANEAMVTLQASDDIDCLVVDYMMPRVTGLQLLERVREEYPRLPYLLITSEGSEDVAAKAIDGAVTDYIVKDPGDDQTALFTSRIRSAVEQYRLQQIIEESEARYRTVTEQSRDALVILQQGSVLFANPRLAEITGRERETLFESNLVAVTVHPADRDRVRTVFDDWYSERSQQALHQARFVRPDGTVRQCECTGKRIICDGEPAVLVSIRDVTERKRRERELQWERELNRTIQKALLEAQTRDSLEEEVVEQLSQYGYSLVWIGEQDDSTLVARTIEGDEGYVDAIDRSLGDENTASEPSVWAVRTDEPQFVQDFTELFPTDWRQAAESCGYRSGAAVPLVYNDITYGLLAVYHAQPGRFDETERYLLMELADTVAFAIHSLETEQTLAADRAETAKIQIVDDSYYLVALALEGAFLDCEEVRVQGSVPHDDDSFIQYLAVKSGAVTSLHEQLEAHPDVTNVVTIDDGETVQLQVTVSGSVPEAHLASQGVFVHSTTLGTDGATLEIELSSRESVHATVDSLDTVYDDVSVLAVTEDREATELRPDSGLERANLTDKQAKALQAGYYHGYFERPRRNTATDIADSLDVSHSTFLQHLHRAQQKVFGQLL